MPPITIVLTAQQVVDAPTIILTDAQLASIHQQEAPPIIITPPAAGGIVLPPEVAGRQVIITPMPWKSGAPRVTADLNDSNVWALPFTPTAFTSAHFAGGEWQSQPWWRLFALIRNRDGVVITRSPSYGVQTPSINMVPGVPPPRSGKYQVVVGEAHTLSVWNVYPTPAGSGRMFMELSVS